MIKNYTLWCRNKIISDISGTFGNSKTKKRRNSNLPFNSWLGGLILLLIAISSGDIMAQASYNYGWEPTGLGSWTTVGAGAFARSTTTPCTGAASARANVYYDVTNTFTSPSLGTSNEGLVTFGFNYKVTQFTGGAAATPDLVEILVQWANSTSGPWTTFHTINSSNHLASTSCAPVSATFTPGSGALYVRFLSKAIGATTDLYFFYDDILVTQGAAPACSSPTAVQVSAVTTNNATISWTASVSSPASGYEYEVRTSGAAGSGATGLFLAGSTASGVLNANVSLSSNTAYSVYVRSNCGSSEYSPWTSAVNFTTLCDPQGIPYVMPIEAATVPALPECVVVQNVNGDANTWTSYAAVTGITGKVMRYLYNTTQAANDWMFTRGLNMTAGTSYRVKFKYKDTAYAEKLKVAIGSSTNNATMTTTLFDVTTGTSGTAVAQQIDFTVPADGVYHIGFQCYSIADQNALYVGEISVELTPTDAVDYANLQAFVVNATAVSTMETCQTVDVYAQAYEPGVTEAAGQAVGLTASIGYSTTDTDPATWPASAWTAATFNVNVGNNDEFKATYATLPAGTYYFASRFQLNGGPYRYGASNNGFWDATTNPNAVLTVTAPVAISASAATPTFCSGGNTDLTATSTNANYTYSWNNGAGTGAMVNVAPTTTTTYTVTGTDSVTGCTSTATVTVTVNPTPSAVSITPSTATICEGSIQQLDAAGGSISGSNTVGNATTLTAATSQPTAFCNRFDHYWSQMVFTAAELATAGVQAGNINAIKFNITTLGSGTNVTDFKVYIGTTASSTLTGFTTTGLTQVFSAATYTHAIGVNTISFDTPYAWDGTSNIIVDMRQTGLDSTNNSQTYYTATTGNTTVVYAITSTVNAGGSDGFAASGPSPTTSVNRLNTTFDWSVNANLTWSPATELYTDAAATVPYVSNSHAATVYAKPTADVTYTATATIGTCTSTATSVITVTAPTVPDFAAIGSICEGSTAPALELTSPNGITGTWSPATVSNTADGAYVFTPDVGQCAVSQTLNVTVTTTPAPTGDSPQDFNTGDTLADFTVVGDGIIWYDAPTDGQVLDANTVLVSGTIYYASQTVDGCESNVRLAIEAGDNLSAGGFDSVAFKYYPNPVKNIITLTYSDTISGLKLYNTIGQQLMVKTVNARETQLDMSQLPTGTYLLEVSAGNTSKMVKLMKN